MISLKCYKIYQTGLASYFTMFDMISTCFVISGMFKCNNLISVVNLKDSTKSHFNERTLMIRDEKGEQQYKNMDLCKTFLYFICLIPVLRN